ncbi:MULTISPECIES: HdeD family acid-resistance protein [unclassified Bradyrhizobium]|uniref:HdeD family acid-resistance protein n=1 Tax=unclassified Bradyrhizobium TaxID=2631580 RepID=UPI0004147182|nr:MULTISPECIES: HdeD family acid-resistance protein [unclassified Bradyrhizobium]MCP3467700.1 HdeD family acid-resistance protein [Bradyrhizobium sp. CCGUVB23]
MTAYDSRTEIEALVPPPFWVCALLGIVLIAAGLFALGDVVFATLISVKLIGVIAIAAGAFEIMHAFWTRGWGGFLWQVLLGVLYLGLGFLLLSQPVSGALILTYFLGAILFASGAIRCVLSFARWRQNGWMMLISGAFATLAGLVILLGFPEISVWALGFLLGVDLISHGLAWLLYALQSVRRTV